MVFELNNAITNDFRVQHSLDLRAQQYTLATFLRKDDTTLEGSMSSVGLAAGTIGHRWNDNWHSSFGFKEFRSRQGAYSEISLNAAYASSLIGGTFDFVRRGREKRTITTADVVVPLTNSLKLGAIAQRDSKGPANSKGSPTGPSTRGALSLQLSHPSAIATATVESMRANFARA